MLNGVKNFTKTKSFHICMLITLIVIILFIVGMLVLRYSVEGETNMPFNLSKVTIISTQEGLDTGDANTKWSFDINQANDIYLYIDRNNDYGKTEIIKSIYIDNFQIESNNIENIKLYKPNLEEENILFKYDDNDIVQNLEYTGDMESDIKNLKIANQGGIVAFRCSNNGIAKYQSDDEEINHSQLLKKAGVTTEELNIKLGFNLTIALESGKEYQAEVKLDLPVDNVIENGNTSKEITNLDNIIFKRIRN